MYSFIDRADPPARPTRSFENQCWEHRAAYRAAPGADLTWKFFYNGNRAQRAARAGEKNAPR